MWLAASALATGFLLSIGALGMVGIVAFFNRGNGMSSNEAFEIAVRFFAMEGPSLAISFGALYLVALLAAVGFVHVKRKLHWPSFLTAGILPMVLPTLLRAIRGDFNSSVGFTILIAAAGACIGWIAGWIWRRRAIQPAP